MKKIRTISSVLSEKFGMVAKDLEQSKQVDTFLEKLGAYWVEGLSTRGSIIERIMGE